jgi:hypothetical protein
MIVHNCIQGSLEWLQLKLGKPSASEFEKILTPKQLKPSSQQTKYACRLVAEKLLNQSVQSLDHLEWIARGKEMEPLAAASYEFETGFETIPIGFVTTDDGLIGASPDRLIKTGTDLRGGLEIKCPAPHTHLEYIYEGFGTDYILQVQGQMWVGELDFVDRFSWHPQAPSWCVRTYRDDAIVRAIESAMVPFMELMKNIETKALAAGAWTPSVSVLSTQYAEENE